MGRRREKQTITSKDVGVLELDKDGKITVNVEKECSICGEKYTIFDPKNPRLNKKGKFSRLPNQWSEDEEMAHKIGHVDSVRVRRILGGFSVLLKDDRKKALDFINEHYAG